MERELEHADRGRADGTEVAATDRVYRIGRRLLVAILIGAVGLHFGYLAANRTPQTWDPSVHVWHSMQVAEGLTGQHGGRFLRHLWTSTYYFYPPGYYLATAPAFLLIGHTINAGIAWQIIYLLGTLGVLYWLIGHYYGPRYGALGAAAYVGFPIVLGFSRMVYIENLLALETVLTILLAMPRRAFDRLGMTLLLGLVVGLGQMTKWQFVLYVGPFLALVFVSRFLALRRDGADVKARLRTVGRALAAAAVALALCGRWYGSHLSQLLADLRYHAYVREMGDSPVGSAPALLYYVQAFPWDMIGVPLSALLLLSIVVFLVRRRASPEGLIWVFSLAVTMFLLAVARHKEGRFMLPVLPLCTALLVGGIAALPRIPRLASVTALLLFAGLNIFTQTIDASAWVPQLHVPIGLGRTGYVLRFGTPEWVMMPISRAEWNIDTAFEEVSRRAAAEGIQASVHWYLKDEEHVYYNWAVLLSHVHALGLRWAQDPADANFAVAHVDEFFGDGEVIAGRRLEEIRTWPLPDGTAVRLYRCRALPHNTDTPGLADRSH